MAIEKLYLTDTFRVWAEKFNATIDASNTATANAEKAVKKAEEALQKAEQAVNDSVKGDDITTIVNEERQVVAKDIAIDGNPEDLASTRGVFNAYPLGENIDFNTVLNQGIYAISNVGAKNGPGYACRLVVLQAPDSSYSNQIAFGANPERITMRNKLSNGSFTNWVKFISEIDLAKNTTAGIVQPDNTTITIQDGIISAKTLGTLDGTTEVNNDFNNLTTAGRYFISTVKNTTTNAPINVTADWWVDVFTYGEGSTKKIIQEARMHSTTSSSATSGVANYLARCCTGTTWGPWEYAYTQFAG